MNIYIYISTTQRCLPFAEVMAAIRQNNTGRLVRKNKFPFCMNMKKYTGKLCKLVLLTSTEQTTSKVGGTKHGTILTKSVMCFPFLWAVEPDQPNMWSNSCVRNKVQRWTVGDSVGLFYTLKWIPCSRSLPPSELNYSVIFFNWGMTWRMSKRLFLKLSLSH